ncbi:chromosomal replication initiator protein DnaA [Candidatus Peregrinibacteria bacterium CG11_big_fil_rev_8_21_14_0_20_41_10]|nr:MAG: chromosomal replication initiator protein DnaA [Candidatus Peregrinibacteria bacterium CG11_big_fil_rev_8_21_14_0_20_41_10]PIZ74876.1 MAG: chromosomal replication initiator protein DnaA [Candidatus Peregrinibacteria bacterium CG_4_10_14_0_2_um_filter_41_8]PJC37875.1 MAG: chromosomal replication initiator protein DnaA [Candidatus Peregrinibacteria bacterium CG_4_9_14_0_2_um_filter_41_14]
MNQTDIWRKSLDILQQNIKKADFLVWFQGTNILKIEQGVAIIGLPSIFAKDWFQKRYRDDIKAALKAVDDTIYEIDFEIDTSLVADGRGVDLQTMMKSQKKKVRKMPNRQEVKVAGEMISKMLNPKYNLENFVVGGDNRLAHAACSAVARRPGAAYNPLFIYGGVGLGKTHLLQATGNEMLRMHPDVNVVYGTAEKFTNEIVDAIRKYDTRSFHRRYRNADCLILDDIQFFANKGKTQEEFFHTFNELYDGNKQIIISSDRPPKELAGLEDRLVSRFEMGMIVDVSIPDYETRLAILQNKCQEQEALLPKEVLEFIAFNCHHNIRELEGVLMQLIARAKLQNSAASVNDVRDILKRLGRTEEVNQFGNEMIAPKSITSSDEILDKIADYFNVTKSDLIGDRRSREIMIPRQISMYIMRHEFDYAYEKIGDVMGGRNHTTAMHAYSKICDSLQVDQKLVRDIGAIKREMGL